MVVGVGRGGRLRPDADLRERGAAVRAAVQVQAPDDDQVLVRGVAGPDRVGIPALVAQVIRAGVHGHIGLARVARAVDLARVVVDRGVDDARSLGRVRQLDPAPEVGHGRQARGGLPGDAGVGREERLAVAAPGDARRGAVGDVDVEDLVPLDRRDGRERRAAVEAPGDAGRGHVAAPDGGEQHRAVLRHRQAVDVLEPRAGRRGQLRPGGAGVGALEDAGAAVGVDVVEALAGAGVNRIRVGRVDHEA